MQCSNCGNDLRPDTKFCTKCGALNPQATTHTPAPPPVPPTPAGSFGNAPRAAFGGGQMAQPARKSGCGKVLLVLAGLGVVGLVVVGIAGYYGYKFAEEKLKSSEAYTVAIATLKQNPAVQEKLGEIKETGFPLGNFQESADGSGTAAYKVSVVGTKAKGEYDVVMRRRQRKWSLVTGRVTLMNGEIINVKSDDMDTSDLPETNDNADEPPPPMPLPPGAKGETIVSGGVLNGKAISKPEPAYPAVGTAVHAAGTVTVQVVVDETGKVISASAVSGHPLLRQAAVVAARQARFKPMLLSGRAVKVSGILTYDFVAR